MTYIYKTLGTSDVMCALMQDDFASWRMDYDACRAIVDHLESLAADTGEPIEFDTVAIRCDYSLMGDLADFNSQYDKECESIDDVRELTEVIEIDGSDRFIIADF